MPAAFYLPTLVAGARACNESACACTILFADINKVNAAAMGCRHACLLTISVCLQLARNVLFATINKVNVAAMGCRHAKARVLALYYVPTYIK